MNIRENGRRSDSGLIFRRIAAYLIDSLCIGAYALLLFLVVTFVVQPEVNPDEHTVAGAAFMQLVGFLTLVLPVLLVFSWLEAGPAQATPGKRLLGLRVFRHDGTRLSWPRSLGRNALKFLPWEIAHTGVHQIFVADHRYPWLGTTAASLGMALALAYLLTCVIGRGRTIYDRVVDARIE